MNFFQPLAILLVCVLAACAPITPMSKAMNGDPSQVIALVRSGQVGPNQAMDNGYGHYLTPFCLMVTVDEVSEAELLAQIQRGAELNQNCLGVTPLQQVAHALFTATNANQTGRMQLYLSRTRFLLSQGAKMNDGSSSMDGVMAYVKNTQKDHEYILRRIEEMDSENQRQAAIDNPLSMQNITSVLSSAAGVVNAYTATKYGTVGTSTLARVPSSPPSPLNAGAAPLSASTSTNVSRKSLEPTTNQDVTRLERKDINEPRPDFGGRMWMEGGGEASRRPVSTRGEACQMAEEDREKTININARDRRDTGVERRSSCSCSFSAGANSWFCRVWFLPKNSSRSATSDK